MYSGTRVPWICPPRSVPWYLESFPAHSSSDPFFTPPLLQLYPLDFRFQAGPRFAHWGLIKCLHLPRSGSFSLLFPALALATIWLHVKKKAEDDSKGHHWLGLLCQSSVLAACFSVYLLFSLPCSYTTAFPILATASSHIDALNQKPSCIDITNPTSPT